MSAYRFHGLRLKIQGDSTATTLVDARLRHFPEAASADIPFDLTIDLQKVAERKAHRIDRPPGTARIIYEFPRADVAYYSKSDQIYMDFDDRVRVLCSPRIGLAEVSYLASDMHGVSLASDASLTIPFIELLKRRGLYGIHAAGLCVNGQGIVLTGPSGSGKTTLAIALLRAGFDFLGDDMLFLTVRSHSLQVLACPDPANVTDATVRMFPELTSVTSMSPVNDRLKRSVRTEELYTSSIVWQCQPSIIVFPRIAHTEKSILTPIEPGEALLDLAPNVYLTELRSSQAHLDILAALARESRCYRLDTGCDLDTLPVMFRTLIE